MMACENDHPGVDHWPSSAWLWCSRTCSWGPILNSHYPGHTRPLHGDDGVLRDENGVGPIGYGCRPCSARLHFTKCILVPMTLFLISRLPPPRNLYSFRANRDNLKAKRPSRRQDSRDRSARQSCFFANWLIGIS